jgi:hypothetical protein
MRSALTSTNVMATNWESGQRAFEQQSGGHGKEGGEAGAE